MVVRTLDELLSDTRYRLRAIERRLALGGGGGTGPGTSYVEGPGIDITGNVISLDAPAMPAPIRYHLGGTATISATTWAAIPGVPAQSMTVTRPLWVLVTLGAWMISSAGETRMGVTLGGATVIDPPNNAQGTTVGSGMWGQTPVLQSADATGNAQRTMTRIVRLEVGTTTFQASAYMATAGTHNVNYVVLEVQPLWYDAAPVPVRPMSVGVTRREHSAQQSFATSNAPLLWGNSISDPAHFSYATATGIFTCMVPGTYRVTSQLGAAATSGPDYTLLAIYKNGVSVQDAVGRRETGSGWSTLIQQTMQLALGDTVQIQFRGAVAAGSTATGYRSFVELVPEVLDTSTTPGPRIATGTATISTGSVANGTGVDVPVVFPAGRFTAPPDGLFAIAGNGRVTISYTTTSLTKDGVTFRADNWSTGAMPANNVLRWTAIQTT